MAVSAKETNFQGIQREQCPWSVVVDDLKWSEGEEEGGGYNRRPISEFPSYARLRSVSVVDNLSSLNVNFRCVHPARLSAYFLFLCLLSRCGVARDTRLASYTTS